MDTLRCLGLTAALLAACWTVRTGQSGPVYAATPAVAPAERSATDAYVHEVTLRAGTVISVRLATTVSSRTSNVEDPVHATLRRPIVVNGVTVVPAGAAVSGYVTQAERSGRVKGRARIGVRFNALRVGDTRYTIRTVGIVREAPGTKKADAAKIGIGAGAGAIVGAISGGKKGAAIGTGVGAAGGTGVVLATRGKEISLGRGAALTTRLSEAVTIRLR
jgi:hypothetical protein